MKLALVILFVLLAIPLAFAPSLSFSLRLNLGQRSYIMAGRCTSTGKVEVGTGLILKSGMEMGTCWGVGP